LNTAELFFSTRFGKWLTVVYNTASRRVRYVTDNPATGLKVARMMNAGKWYTSRKDEEK
jgi:hypothetical protein